VPEVNKLPNFFILGAAKSGTTSLFNILASHSQIFASPKKETGFFNNDERYSRGISWYQETYFNEAQGYPIRMEATPAYLTWSKKTAKRLKDEYPVRPVKFALVFRDPVQRAYSHYWHRVRLGHETLSFEDAIKQEPTRLAENYDELYRTGDGKFGYFRAGCYASRLKPFFEQFDKKNFFFLLQDDFSSEHFPKIITDLQRFLWLETIEILIPQRANPASLPRKRWLADLYRRLKRTYLSRVYREKIDKSLRATIYSYLFPPITYPPMSKDMEKRLRSRYFDEIKALEQIIDRDLSAWLE
jgi:hypothetical protein